MKKLAATIILAAALAFPLTGCGSDKQTMGNEGSVQNTEMKQDQNTMMDDKNAMNDGKDTMMEDKDAMNDGKDTMMEDKDAMNDSIDPMEDGMTTDKM